MMRRQSPLAMLTMLALVGVNVWLLRAVIGGSPEGETAAVRQWSPNLPQATAAAPVERSESAGDVLARPVFFKSRQPYVAPPPAAPKVATPLTAPVVVDPGFTLTGIAIDGAAKRAYLVNKADARGAWVSEGDAISGWSVDVVDATSVVLRQGGRSIHLQLYPPSR